MNCFTEVIVCHFIAENCWSFQFINLFVVLRNWYLIEYFNIYITDLYLCILIQIGINYILNTSNIYTGQQSYDHQTDQIIKKKLFLIIWTKKVLTNFNIQIKFAWKSGKTNKKRNFFLRKMLTTTTTITTTNMLDWNKKFILFI